MKYLWYVGDFASFNQNCQDTTRKVAEVLTAAGVDFGIMGKGKNLLEMMYDALVKKDYLMFWRNRI